MLSDEVLKKMAELMRNPTPELLERRRRCEEVYLSPLHCEERDGTWTARRHIHVGVGPTRSEAIDDLHKKIDLALGGPFGPLGNQPWPTL